MRLVTLACSVWLVAAAPPALAVDLVDAWHAAHDHDLEFAAARAAHDAGGARREQGASLWRPTVQFTGGVGRASSETSTTGAQFAAPGFGRSNGVDFDTSVSNGNSTRWAVQARQPLVSRERDAQRRQLELSADVADLEWASAQQSLMLRTAQRYFDVLLAAESLNVLQRQQTAVERAGTEARDRFRLGDTPITDSHEAAARVEAIRAQVLAAETQLQLARAALSDATGLPADDLPALAPTALTGATELPPLDTSLADARANNPQLRMQTAATEVARHEAAKFSASASASLDLVANVGRDRLNGSGDFGDASNRANNAMIGLQLTVPLYSGGYRSAKQTESQRLADKAAAQAELAGQQIAQQTRAAWLALTVGGSRVGALAESLKSTRARLDATRLGRQVGDRTTQDLLNAENDTANAELSLLQARVALLIDRLRLAALTGRLDEAQLRSVNAALIPPPHR